MSIQKLHQLVFIAIIILWMSPILSGQNEKEENQITINLDEIENSGRRVEIQRYIGYENLLSRYLTLPYDVSLNTSNQGRYFDIGFILIALIPIALLILSYQHKKIFYSLLISEALYLLYAFNYSYVNIEGKGPVYFNSNNWEFLAYSDSRTFIQSLLVHIYDFAAIITFPINYLVKNISGQSDHVTYLILCLLFVLFLFMINKIFGKNRKFLVLSAITLSFSFMWIFLSGGIIWYGFLIIPLGLSCMFRSLIGPNSKHQSHFHVIMAIVYLSIIPWILFSYTARVSNIQYTQPNVPNIGTNIVNPQLISYSTGLIDSYDLRNFMYQNNSQVFEKINSNNDLIYQVGTSTAFEIKNNPIRIYQDNTLITFFNLLNIYRDKEVIIEAIKASGYRYIIIDLFTHTMDKTPEKSLVKKYQLFLNTVYKNDKLKMLATDRVVQLTGDDGTIQYRNDVFGLPNDSNDKISIKEFGSYAIYEIL